MSQDPTARKHQSHPNSAAAWEHQKALLADAQKAVFSTVCRSRGKGITVDEASVRLHTTPNAISGRFTELYNRGVIKAIGKRPTRTGRNAAVYVKA